MAETGRREPVGRLRILMVNDVYAQETDGSGRGGWAALAAAVEEQRAEARAAGTTCLFVVCGDFLGGSALGEAFEGRHVVEMFDALGVDMVVVGNHEFDFGDDVLIEYMTASSYPWLATNVFTRTDASAAEPDWRTLPIIAGGTRSHVVDVAPAAPGGRPIKVGFIGLCTAATPNLSFPSDNVVFAPPVAVATAAVDELKGDVDAVFALTHLREAADIELAQAVPELSLLLGGHDHSPMLVVEHDTVLLKAGMDNQYLGVVDVAFYERPDSSALRPVFSPGLIANVGYAPDPAIAAILEKYADELAAKVAAAGGADVVLTLPPDAVLDTRSETVRRTEAPVCNLIADALHAYFAARGAVGAIINGGFVRGNRVYRGPTDLTVADIRYELPFPKTIALISLTPAVFKAALEQMLSNAPDAAGSYPHLSATLSMEYDVTREVGSRVLSISLGSVPLDLSEHNTDTMLITITSFMAVGGDSVDSWLRGTIIENLEGHGPTIGDIVIDYLARVAPHLTPAAFLPAGRVTDVSHDAPEE